MTVKSLSLNNVVHVMINLSLKSAPRKAFNLGLIIGSADVIPVYERVRIYTGTDSMLTDGFVSTDPEYKAAQLYFSAKPIAPTRLAVGRRNMSGSVSAAVISTAGSGYDVDDILTITGGSQAATLKVLAVDEAGAITQAIMTADGAGYATGAGIATTVVPAGGVGAKVDVTAVAAETPLQAIQACRAANTEWYVGVACGAAKAEIKDMAAYVETATPSTVLFFTTADADVPGKVAGNIFEFLKEKLYRRTMGQYCSQPDTPDAVAAILGYAMGNNTGLNNSAYTLAYKTEVGVTPESLSDTQVENIKGNNGNVYIQRGEYYNLYEQGWMADKSSFDEVINLDMLANKIQLNMMDTLYQNPKVPQTEPGVTQLINAANKACDEGVNIGFIAPGQWNGPPRLNLKTGDYLPKGYLVQAESINSQSQADRDARKAPPIYASTKLAGAIEFVTIQVDVNR